MRHFPACAFSEVAFMRSRTVRFTIPPQSSSKTIPSQSSVSNGLSDITSFINAIRYPLADKNASTIRHFAITFCLAIFLLIYHVMRTDTCIKPHTLRDTVTGRNRNRKKQHTLFISKMAKDNGVTTMLADQLMARRSTFTFT